MFYNIDYSIITRSAASVPLPIDFYIWDQAKTQKIRTTRTWDD